MVTKLILNSRKPKAKKPSQPVAKKTPPKPKPKRRMEENLRTSYMAPLPPSTPVLSVIPTYVNYDCVIFVQQTGEGTCSPISMVQLGLVYIEVYHTAYVHVYADKQRFHGHGPFVKALFSGMSVNRIARCKPSLTDTPR